jgi:hypothetical protein
LESYRSAKGSRHRVVAYLGKLSAGETSGWEKLSARLEGKAAKEPGLFDAVAAEDDAIGETALVDLKNVQLANVREFGQVWLAWTLWRMLGLDELLMRQMSRGLEAVPWHVTAAILCIARFCRPSSELHIERHFYPKSALEDLLNVPAAQVQTDRLYRGLDQLLGHKKAIEQHLRQRMGRLFDLRFDILLYDLTSTYFEGQCADNDQAKRGYSRDNRGDCPQVVIALIVTTDGYAMWKTLGGWMKASGLGDSPRELLEEMAAVKTGDIILPTRASDNTPGPTLMIRCVTRPDAHTEVLLNRLGVRLPNQLKRQRMTMPAMASEPCTV